MWLCTLFQAGAVLSFLLPEPPLSPAAAAPARSFARATRASDSGPLGRHGGGCYRAAGPRRPPAAAAAAWRRPEPYTGDCLPAVQLRACSNKAVPNRQSPPHAWLGAGHALRRTRSRTKLWAWAFQRPHTSEPSTTSVCGPLRASSGYAARLRRSATRSTAAAHGCGGLDRASGDTSVPSQHCAPPLRSAPCTTRSSLRRSDPIASRATRTRFTILARLARSPVRGHTSAWSPTAVQRQRLSQATPQSDLCSGRWERGGRLGWDRSEPSSCLRSCLGSQKCLTTVWNRVGTRLWAQS